MSSLSIFVSVIALLCITLPWHNGTSASVTSNEELLRQLKVLSQQVGELRTKVQTLENKQQNHEEEMTKCTDTCPRPHTVAFYASLSNLISLPDYNFVVPFDVIGTNIGHGYNETSGEFTAPHHGVYSMTWTMGLTWKTTLCSTLRINGEIVARSLGSTPFDSFGAQMTTGIMTSCLRKGDVVTVETCENLKTVGMILSDPYRTSSFSGFRVGKC